MSQTLYHYNTANKDQHITLTRPHTVLLQATVRGGVAYRGQFTGSMAEELHSADGNKDIYAMFNDAAAKLREETDGDPQNPRFESVTYKTLVLPPAIQSLNLSTSSQVIDVKLIQDMTACSSSFQEIVKMIFTGKSIESLGESLETPKIYGRLTNKL